MRIVTVFMLVLGLCFLTAGCGGETDKDKKTAKKHSHDDHADHGDHIGGNNPHKIEFKDAPFNAKWAHAGDLVTITITDNEYKKDMPIAAAELVVVDKGGKNEYKLPALKKNEKGEAAVFELESEALEMTMDNEPTLKVKLGDKEHKTVVYHIH